MLMDKDKKLTVNGQGTIKKYLFDDIRLVRDGKKKILKVSEPFKSVPPSIKIATIPTKRVNEVVKFYKGKLNEVILADEDNPVSLGGGFVQIDGQDVLFVKRDLNAIRKPGLLDISAGLFDEIFRNPVEMMVSETAEIVRRQGEDFILPVPEENAIKSDYIETLKKEFKKSLDSLKVSGRVREVKANVLQDESYTVLEYDGEESIGVIVSLEPDSGSVEIIGVLKVDLTSAEYSDGEYRSAAEGLLPLNREIHQVNLNSLVDRVWRGFKQISATDFIEVIRKIKKEGQKVAFTSKVANALMAEPLYRYPIRKALEVK